MAFLKIDNVRICGFSACVPKTIVSNEITSRADELAYGSEDFVKTTGVRERRIDNRFASSDLCYEAAEKLISDLNWDKKEIDALIFVSQTRDYIVPSTSTILQDRLGLSRECFSEDISMGCSGWVYALSTLSSLMQTGQIKKALLLTGEIGIYNSDEDMLFGSAGTATALEYNESVHSMYFHLGTDGSGYDTIIIPDGGARNPFNEQSLILEEVDGHKSNRVQTRMKGMDVFSFGISTAPKSVKRLSEKFNLNYLESDYFIFHQANMKMNKMIEKKLKLDTEKVPYSMTYFGNTSSASIPLTIVTELKNKIENKPTKFVCCGFGVGLSWGTVAFKTENLVISNLVEI